MDFVICVIMIPPYVIMGMYDYISMPGNVLIIIRNAVECKQSLREIHRCAGNLFCRVFSEAASWSIYRTDMDKGERQDENKL